MRRGPGTILRVALRRLAPQKRTEINAIHAHDTHAVLKRLGASGELAAGRVHCAACNTELDEDSVGAMRESNLGLVFACGQVECIRRL